ncbi:MAG: DUF2974 domain-containing protein [Planctomycetaceae bacterium]|jgi:hypothetical protein|nr:DUF2974 domain-containing protein [Planctomycetaceae bacterium]
MSEILISGSGTKSIAQNEIDQRFINFQEYRCALASAKVYQLADLNEIGLPTASPDQIKKIFGETQISQYNSNGFKTQLYHDQHSDKFILGFSGTIPTNINDWRTNFNQFFGKKAEQYIRGIELVNNIREDYIDRVIVTGHSLGGGIATVAAIARQLKCITFNPPAIHKNTLKQFEPINYTNINKQISRFVVAGEILDLINKTFSIKQNRIGTKYNLYGSWKIPNLLGLFLGRKLIAKLIPHPIILLAGTIGLPLLEKSIELHNMNEVICGLKKYLEGNSKTESRKPELF